MGSTKEKVCGRAQGKAPIGGLEDKVPQKLIPVTFLGLGLDITSIAKL